MRTAESVLFTCWPPAPLERYVSMRRSDSSISTGASSGRSGATTTCANAVCRRCAASNGESRTSRWTPRSAFSVPYAFSPLTATVADLRPASSPGLASSTSASKPRSADQRRYMRRSMSAQSCASVPPVPAWISRTASPASYCPVKSASSCERGRAPPRADATSSRSRSRPRRARAAPSRPRTRPAAARSARACASPASARWRCASRSTGRPRTPERPSPPRARRDGALDGPGQR